MTPSNIGRWLICFIMLLFFASYGFGQQVSSLSLKPASLYGGSSAVATVTLSSEASSTGLRVSLSSNKACAKTPATVTVPAGSRSTTFTITTTPVGAQTTAAVLAVGGGDFATANLTVNPPTVLSVTINPGTVYGGRPGRVTVTLTGSAPEGGLNVSLSSSDPQLVDVPETLPIPSLASSSSLSFATGVPHEVTQVSVKAALGSVSKSCSITVLGLGLNDDAPWPKFRGDARNTGQTINLPSASDWTAPIGLSVSSSPAVGELGDIYVGADDGYVYCFEPLKGHLVWAFKTGDRVSSSPVVSAQNVVFIGSADGYVYALNGATGALIWRHETGGPVSSTPAIGADGKIYVGSFDHYIYALSQTDGSLYWRYQTGGAVDSSPNLASDGTLYVGSDDFDMYAIDTTVPKLKWTFRTGSFVDSSPAIADGRVYFGSYDGKVYGLNSTTGTMIWSYQTGWVIHSSPCLGSLGSVYIGSDDAHLYAIDGANGHAEWVYNAGDSVGCSPAIGQSGSIFFASEGGNMYELSSGGALLASAAEQDYAESSPAVGPSGAALLCSNTGRLIRNTMPLYAGYSQWSGNGHWYKAVASVGALSWTAAEQACEAQGGHLATITSQAENDFVFSLIDDPKYWVAAGPYLGATAPEPRVTPSTGWTWITGETWGYTSWCPGEPNNGNGGGTRDACLLHKRR